MQELELILGYEFKDKKLLTKALTHSSITADVAKNYERLEFLGDRVLGVAVAALLFEKFSSEPEGDLSQRFVRLVKKETVAEVALNLGLDRFIRAENSELKTNVNVLCDVCEAVIGAIYIDAGEKAAIDFVENHWRELIDKNKEPKKDAKTGLQEWAHKYGYGTPHYEIVGRSGSEHEPIFEVEVSLGVDKKAKGKGKNKKAAEFNAANTLLEMLAK